MVSVLALSTVWSVLALSTVDWWCNGCAGLEYSRLVV